MTSRQIETQHKSYMSHTTSAKRKTYAIVRL